MSISNELNNIKEIKLVGKIASITLFYLYKHEFDVVDLTEAEFIEEDKEEYMFCGFSHSGPVYSNKKVTHHYDYLSMFAEDVCTQKIIVPATLKRRHMNRFTKNYSIEQIIVPEDSLLFSMKDGNVYNKKGTTLVYKNKKRLRKR